VQKRKDNRERATSGDRDSQKENKNSNKNIEPKAVLYVPYTPNSELAKELRKVEEVMEKMSGMRMKVVEKAGIQLKRILVKTNPWAGTDCQREDCLVCLTRQETGEGRGKTCSKRNILYETWFETCQDRDKQKAMEEGRDPENIPLHKYIGESSRSSYLRGKNHIDDARLMSSGSHMLKHFLDQHRQEDPEDDNENENLVLQENSI
jgi:type III secretory pathway component EscV